MLKRDITYKNPFDDEETTESFYFGLSRHEIIEMEVGHAGGLQEALQRMVKAQDLKGIMAEIRQIILTSYGVKSETGKRFMKSEELRTEFIETGAFDSLFMELAFDDKAAATFITGIIPVGFMEALAKAPDIPTSTVMPQLPKE